MKRNIRIDSGETDGSLAKDWQDYVQEPSRSAHLPVPQLVTLKSPYRFVITPILNYVLQLERSNPDRQVSTGITGSGRFP